MGVYIIGDDDIVLPFSNMAITLTYIVIPVCVGIVINRFLPKVGKVILKLQKWMIVITIAFLKIFGKSILYFS